MLPNGLSFFTLEDKDRGLSSAMPLSEIVSKKVYGKTAIPSGRYELALTYSDRFKRILPLLLDVPGFAGIRIHPGNWAANTEGCLLLGIGFAEDAITESKKACDAFMKQFEADLKTEKVYITII